MIDIKMKKVYGFNKYDNEISFKSDTKHNFIYGVNATGKTSFSKGIELLIENKEYKKLMDSDSDNYYIDFKFDDLCKKVSDTKSVVTDVNNFNKRVFVFTKKYLNQHVSFVNSDNSNIQIGIRIAERENNIKKIDELTDELQKNIFDKIKKANLKTTKDSFIDNSNILTLKSTLKDKAKERLSKQLAVKELIKNNIKETPDYIFNAEDFNGNNIKILTQLKNVLSLIIDKANVIIKDKIKEGHYTINNVDDKEFYDYIVDYLKNNNELESCPICNNPNFDIDKIIKDISLSLNLVIKNEIISKYNNYYEKLEANDESVLYRQIKVIYNQLLNGDINIEEIKKVLLQIDDLTNYYDYYLLKFIKYDINSFESDNYNKILRNIEEINVQNNEYSENDAFLDKFNEMLNYIFENDELKAEKYEYMDSGNKYYGIQLIINGITKKGISIEDFWNEILSESQKTKISLSFLFAVVLYNNCNGKILCIFDDPIDSYDSLNKYKMARIIYEFIEKKSIFSNYSYDCYDLIFSHSIEYMRLFNENINSSATNKFIYWVMSKNNIDEIKKEHLFLLRGDYSILNHLFNESHKNILMNTEFISLLPILRELSSIDRKVFDKENTKISINNNNICDLDKFISTNIIHGFNINIKIKDLIEFILKYVDINVERQYDDEKLFDYLKKYIDLNINNMDNLDFYNQIFFKNIMAIYVRAKYDYDLTVAIKQDIPKYNNKTLEDIHDDLREIFKKHSVLYKNANTCLKYNDLLVKVSKAKPMLNDFAHSANIFLTPLIDVTLNELVLIYNDLSD